MFIKKKFLRLALILFSMICLGAFWAHSQYKEYMSVSRIDEKVLVTVDPGDFFSKVGKTLKELKVVDDLTWWRWIPKFSPTLSNVRSGTYQLEKNWNLAEILFELNFGDEYQFNITLVEGNTFEQWLDELSKAESLNFKKMDEKELLIYLKSPYKKIEGLLSPETYNYSANSNALDIIKRAYSRQQNILEKLWEGRASNLPLKSPYEALILASIIEKESGVAADRHKIASVFINRLNKKMRLQTDPTVIYGLGERYKGKIRSKHLKEKTEYNTYRFRGLPPTPIAMPSFDSIHAALHPENTRYLYFVSKGDGSSHFSKTLTEHNSAVRRYILNKSRNK